MSKLGWNPRDAPITRAKDSAYMVSWSPDGRLIGSAGADGRFIAYMGRSGKLAHEQNLNTDRDTVPLTSLVWGSSSTYYVAKSNGVVAKHDLKEREALQTWVEQGNDTYTLAINKEATLLASGGSDGCIRLYDCGAARATPAHVFATKDKFEAMNNPIRIYALRYCRASPHVLASGGWQTVKLWDVRARGEKPVREILGPYMTGDGLDFASDGSLVTASHRIEDQVEVWDWGSGKKVRTVAFPTAEGSNAEGESGGGGDSSRDPPAHFPFLPAFVRCAKKGACVAVGGGGEGVGTVNAAFLVDTKTNAVVGKVPGNRAFHCASFNGDDTAVAFGDAAGRVHILDRA